MFSNGLVFMSDTLVLGHCINILDKRCYHYAYRLFGDVGQCLCIVRLHLGQVFSGHNLCNDIWWIWAANSVCQHRWYFYEGLNGIWETMPR
jgi:hypothetical protein